jgi:hypothetical protein
MRTQDDPRGGFHIDSKQITELTRKWMHDTASDGQFGT